MRFVDIEHEHETEQQAAVNPNDRPRDVKHDVKGQYLMYIYIYT